jgi:hypothetical protein
MCFWVRAFLLLVGIISLFIIISTTYFIAVPNSWYTFSKAVFARAKIDALALQWPRQFLNRMVLGRRLCRIRIRERASEGSSRGAKRPRRSRPPASNQVRLFLNWKMAIPLYTERPLAIICASLRGHSSGRYGPYREP